MSEEIDLKSEDSLVSKDLDGSLKLPENPSDKFKIAAVVVTFNRLELLKICINALREQTRKLDEIIVINNSSSDGSLEWLSEQNDLTLITQPNSGGAGGFHTGIKTAYEKGYDWIWCMDDDVMPEKYALKSLINFILHNNDAISGLACRRVDETAKQALLGEVFTTDFTKIRHDSRYIIRFSNIGELIQAQNIFSATFEGMMVNRSAIDKVGLPNKHFFIWHDDLEYSIKLNKYGKIFLVPSSVLIKKELKPKEVRIDRMQVLKYLYGIRNLSYIEFNCLTDQKLNPVIKVLSVLSYFSRYVRLVLHDSNDLRLKLKYILKGIQQLYFGYKGKLGVIDE